MFGLLRFDLTPALYSLLLFNKQLLAKKSIIKVRQTAIVFKKSFQNSLVIKMYDTVNILSRDMYIEDLKIAYE